MGIKASLACSMEDYSALTVEYVASAIFLVLLAIRAVNITIATLTITVTL
jgi:hypothetical protein